MERDARTYVFPALGSSCNLWFCRVAGHGLGNCFYTYFHAVRLAEMAGASILAPSWATLKVGPLLRGDRSKRLYWGMFRSHKDEICGHRKALLLGRLLGGRVLVPVGADKEPRLHPDRLNIVTSEIFTFNGLHSRRQAVRDRLLAIMTEAPPAGHTWGGGGYIAVHVRLGDFSLAIDRNALISGKWNTQIPMSWYADVIHLARRQHPGLPVLLFSDGTPEQLAPLTALGAQITFAGSDILDLLAMAKASVLVGSHSTFSYWAAFLGNMPSYWLNTEKVMEQPTDPSVPFFRVALDECCE